MKLYLFLFIFILSLSIVSAGDFGYDEDIGVGKVNNCIALTQVCTNCTYVNITSITYPNRTKIVSPLSMIENGTEFTYNYCATSLVGKYTYNTQGDLDGGIKTQSINFNINYQGKSYQTIDGLLYIILLLILAGIFIGAVYFTITIETANYRNEYGDIIKINYKKYIKWGTFVVAYLTFVAINYFSWNIVYGILEFTEMAKFFRVLYTIAYTLILPIFFIILGYMFFSYVKDRSLEKLIKQGLTAK